MRRASFCMARPAVTDVMLMHVPRIHCTGRRLPALAGPLGLHMDNLGSGRIRSAPRRGLRIHQIH